MRSVGPAVAVGPNGSDLTRDGGRTWHRFSDTGFDAVQCTKDGACWASGTDRPGRPAGALTPVFPSAPRRATLGS